MDGEAKGVVIRPNKRDRRSVTRRDSETRDAFIVRNRRNQHHPSFFAWLIKVSKSSTRGYPRNHRKEEIVVEPRKSTACRLVWCCHRELALRREWRWCQRTRISWRSRGKAYREPSLRNPSLDLPVPGSTQIIDYDSKLSLHPYKSYVPHWTRLAVVYDAEWTSRYAVLSPARKGTFSWELHRSRIHPVRTSLLEVHCTHRFLLKICYAQSCVARCTLKEIISSNQLSSFLSTR